MQNTTAFDITAGSKQCKLCSSMCICCFLLRAATQKRKSLET